MRPSRWVPAALTMVCVAALAAVPVLFRDPPSTIASRSRLLELAVPVSGSDSSTTGWSQADLDSVAQAFSDGLRIRRQPSDSLAVGIHSLYPYRFLTVRGGGSITVALKRPWPPGPAGSTPAAGLAAEGPDRSGGCLVYTLRREW